MISILIGDDGAVPIAAVRAACAAASCRARARLRVVHTNRPAPSLSPRYVVPFRVDDRARKRRPLGRQQTQPRERIEQAQCGELHTVNSEQYRPGRAVECGYGFNVRTGLLFEL